MKKVSTQPERILIVKLSSFGDVLHTLPIVSDITSTYPQAQIDWVVEESYVPVLEKYQQLNPSIRLVRIIPFSLRRWKKTMFTKKTWLEIRAFLRQLKAVSYDWVLDLQGLTKSAWVASRAFKKEHGITFGFANGTLDSGYEPVARWAYDVKIKLPQRVHAVDRSRLFWQAILEWRKTPKHFFDFSNDIPIHFSDPQFGLISEKPILGNEIKKKARVLCLMHTAGIHKFWGESNWISFCCYLMEQDIEVELGWGSEVERAYSLKFIEKIKIIQQHGVIELSSARSWVEWIDALPCYMGVIGVDTGLTHLATMLGLPVIEIYVGTWRWKTACFWSSLVENLGDKEQSPSFNEVKDSWRRLIITNQGDGRK
jgi:heptosyltransferase-1